MAQTDTHNEALPAHRYRARKLCFLSLAVVCTVLAVFVLTFSLGFTSRPSNVGASYPQSTSSADVLLVMSYDENDAGTQLARDGVLDVLGRSSVNIDIVYMDAYHAPLQSTTHATWANRVGQQVSQRGGYDIVICCDDEALGFVEQNHDTMFAATPVVFFGVNDVAHAQSVANSGYATGMIEQGYVGEIMQVTYRLHPDATSFTAIVDQTPAGIGNKAQFVSAAQDFEDMGVYYVNTSAFTRNELGEYVSSASPDTIMFLLDASVDNSGNVYATDDTIAWVSSTSSVPVYCVTVGSVGSGAAGSSFLDPQQDGRKAAEMAITVLNGTSPSAIPLVVDGTHGYVFDQQVLNSYGISVADVPAGSTVVNRQLFSLDTLRIIVLPLILLVLAVIFFLQSRKMRHLQVAAEAAGVGAGTAAPVVTVPVESVVEEEPAPVVNAVAEAVAEAPVAAAVATPAKQVDASAAKRTKKKQLPAKERRRRDTKRGHQRQLRHTHPVSVKAEDAKPAPEDDEKLVTGHDELLEDVATIEVVADETPEEIEAQVEASAEGAVVEELEETPAEADDVLDETPEEIEAQVEASAEGSEVEELEELAELEALEAQEAALEPEPVPATQAIQPSDMRAMIGVEVLNLDDVIEEFGAQAGEDVLGVIHKRLAGVENSRILDTDGSLFLLGFYDAVLPGSRELELVELMLSQPITVGERSITLSSCIGAVNRPHSLNFAEMRKVGAFARKQAEERGHTNNIVLYDDDLFRAAQDRDKIARLLQEALDMDDFLVFYQPQVDLHKNEVVGYEALVRMRDRAYPPAQFIPVAEVTGLITEVDRVVTKRAIELLSVWKRRKKRMRPISINFSSVHLTRGDDFAAYLLDLLDTYGVPSEYIRVEVDESLFSSENQQNAEEMVRRLFDAGISIALDNFGKGCSAFTDIMAIPASVIKIDKEFVDTFLVDGHDQNFEQLVRLAHGLGRKVVVVGVDKRWQIEACRSLNCDVVQGYYFSKPLLPENAVQYKPRP